MKLERLLIVPITGGPANVFMLEVRAMEGSGHRGWSVFGLCLFFRFLYILQICFCSEMICFCLGPTIWGPTAWEMICLRHDTFQKPNPRGRFNCILIIV